MAERTKNLYQMVEERYKHLPHWKDVLHVAERMSWCPDLNCRACEANFGVLDALIQATKEQRLDLICQREGCRHHEQPTHWIDKDGGGHCAGRAEDGGPCKCTGFVLPEQPAPVSPSVPTLEEFRTALRSFEDNVSRFRHGEMTASAETRLESLFTRLQFALSEARTENARLRFERVQRIGSAYDDLQPGEVLIKSEKLEELRSALSASEKREDGWKRVAIDVGTAPVFAEISRLRDQLSASEERVRELEGERVEVVQLLEAIQVVTRDFNTVGAGINEAAFKAAGRALVILRPFEKK